MASPWGPRCRSVWGCGILGARPAWDSGGTSDSTLNSNLAVAPILPAGRTRDPATRAARRPPSEPSMPDVAVLNREDLAMFINAACACTGQSEFYGADREQRISLDFLHAYVAHNYRGLYALCLVAGINHFNQGLVVERLLALGAPKDPSVRARENALLTNALRRLPPQRVYRLFGRLRRARVNNRRTRALLTAWLAQRDLAFDAVKYRGLLRSSARHTHARLVPEVHGFLFDGPHSRTSWDAPLLDAFRRAKYDQRAIYELPFTVAEGLAVAKGIPRKRFLERIAPQMTKAERERTLARVEREGLTADVDLARWPLTRACLRVLSLPIAERERFRDPLRASARRALAGRPTLPARVRVVLDSSHSARGGAQKRNRPLAVALGIALLVEEGCADGRCWWSHAQAPADALTVRPVGQTRLADGLLDALEDAPDLVIVVSDGFENDPPGACGEVVRLFREHVDPEGRTAIVHLDPVFDATAYMPRALGPSVPTVGIRDAEELPLKLAFARFTHGDVPLAELEAWLLERSASELPPEPSEPDADEEAP